MARTQRTELLPRADAILDATAELLLSDGSRPPRVDEVARRAGIAKGTVYLHWRSRDELLLAVGAREAAAMFDAVAAAMAADAGEVALHRYLRRHFLAAMRRPILRSLFVADSGRHAALTRQRERSGIAAARLTADTAYLATLAEHRLLRPGQDLDALGHGVQAVAYGFFAAEQLLADERSLDERAEQLAEIVRRSFEPDRPAAPEHLAAAAPAAIAVFTDLAAEFRHLAYGHAG